MASSQQVDGRTLTILRAIATTVAKQHGLEFVQYPWLSAFHQAHWGVLNGRQIIMADGRPAVCIIDHLKIKRRYPILVRQAFLDLWRHLCEVYLERDESLSDATIIYGHPGIGKTVSALHVMCAAAEAQIPFVFYSTGKSYAFVCLDVGQFLLPPDMVSALVFTTRALIIIDSNEPVSPNAQLWSCSSAHVVLVSSPATARYDSLVNHLASSFFTMDLASEGEFLDMIELETVDTSAPHMPVSLGTATVTPRPVPPTLGDTDVDSDFDVDVETIGGIKYWKRLAIFRLFGPNVRFALQRHRWTGEGPHALLPTLDWHSLLPYITRALLILAGRSEIYLTRPDRNSGFHWLFFEQPGRRHVTEQPPNNLVVPTAFLRSVLANGVRVMQHRERVELLSAVQGSYTVRGIVLESAALQHIARASFRAVLTDSTRLVILARPSFRYTVRLDNDQSLPTPLDSIPFGACPACDLSAEPTPIIPDRVGCFICPPGFPTADAIILADGDGADMHRYEIVLQMAIAKRHTIKKRGLEVVTRALDQHTHGRPRIRVLLFVCDTELKSQKLRNVELPAWMKKDFQEWVVGSATLSERELLGIESEDGAE